MAGDWLKVEKDTPWKIEILFLADRLKISRHEAFSRCFMIWSWADSHSADGFVQRLSPDWVDVLVGLPGFAAALIETGWLRVRSGGLEFPHFNRHMGQSAKARGLAARRASRARSRPAEKRSARSRYGEKLRDPRWQRLRLEIMQRDEWTCQKCGAKDRTLHVHHTRYLKGRNPWDYPPELLLTLCEDCHDGVHGHGQTRNASAPEV